MVLNSLSKSVNRVGLTSKKVHNACGLQECWEEKCFLLWMPGVPLWYRVEDQRGSLPWDKFACVIQAIELPWMLFCSRSNTYKQKYSFRINIQNYVDIFLYIKLLQFPSTLYWEILHSYFDSLPFHESSDLTTPWHPFNPVLVSLFFQRYHNYSFPILHKGMHLGL